MPNIADHQSNGTTKLLLIGESGSGKTGALASLAAAGYQLRIVDLDNGLDVLKNYLTHPDSIYVKANPEVAKNCSFVTLTDTMKSLNGRLIPKKASVWQDTMKQLDKWIDGDKDYGGITTWDANTILVIDTLSMLSQAALNFHLSLNSGLAVVRTQNEARRDIGAAQNLLRDLLQMLSDKSVTCNVIVNSHITFVSESGTAPTSGSDINASPGIGYPSAIGRALSPHIPRYFNSVLLAKTVGAGNSVKHKIFTKTQAIGYQLVNAKNSSPMNVLAEYPLETCLADYFKAVRGR